MQEKLYFKNKEGLKFCGIISNSTDDKSKIIVILCHGAYSDKDNPTNLKLEETLNEGGISTFR